jgi:hypothetical protein
MQYRVATGNFHRNLSIIKPIFTIDRIYSTKESKWKHNNVPNFIIGDQSQNFHMKLYLAKPFQRFNRFSRTVYRWIIQSEQPRNLIWIYHKQLLFNRYTDFHYQQTDQFSLICGRLYRHQKRSNFHTREKSRQLPMSLTPKIRQSGTAAAVLPVVGPPEAASSSAKKQTPAAQQNAATLSGESKGCIWEQLRRPTGRTHKHNWRNSDERRKRQHCSRTRKH